MSDYIPDGCIKLRAALDLAGRNKFGSEWTGDELDAHYVPDAETLRARLTSVRNAAEQAHRMWRPPLPGISHDGPVRRPTVADLEKGIRQREGLFLYPAPGGPEYEAQRNAWERREAAQTALRHALYGGEFDAAYLNASNGKRVVLRAEWWASDEGGKALQEPDRGRTIVLRRADVERVFVPPREGDGESGVRRFPPPLKEILKFFLNDPRGADGSRSMRQCMNNAAEHFKTKWYDGSGSRWRKAWQQVPDDRKRGPGNTLDRGEAPPED